MEKGRQKSLVFEESEGRLDVREIVLNKTRLMMLTGDAGGSVSEKMKGAKESR